MAELSQGGYVSGPLHSGLTYAVIPDECILSADDVKAGRWVCSRPGHPTATSDCREDGPMSHG